MLMLLLAAQAAAAIPPAPVRTAIEAERAFLRDAQTTGQWTAFRKWAADDAVMFTPLTVSAQKFLEPLKDPPASIYWWPTTSFVSCDGELAVNSGPWVKGGGRALGYYTSIWRKADGQWRWIYDAGDNVSELPATKADLAPTTASCTGDARGATDLGAAASEGVQTASGHSPDHTLAWNWSVGGKGDRRFIAQLWDGKSYRTVLDQQVAAAK